MSNEYQTIDEYNISEERLPNSNSDRLNPIRPRPAFTSENDSESENIFYRTDNSVDYGSNNMKLPSIADNQEDSNPNREYENYPPGMSVTGSTNLPVLDVPSHAVSNKKKKRKRKNRVEGVSSVDESGTDRAGSGWEEPSDQERKLNGDIKKNKSLLPPIKTKSSVHAVNAAIAFNPNLKQLPEVESNTMAKISDTGKGNFNKAFEAGESISSEDHYESEPHDFYSLMKKSEALCFRDKIRKIDYVLVYKEEDGYEEDKDEQKKADIRKVFHQKLEDEGVDYEIEPKEESQDGKTCFVKIHIPWEILLKWAERMKVKMPLKVERDDNEDEVDDGCCDMSWFERLKQKILNPFKLNNNLINEQFGDQDYYTAEFTKEKKKYFDIKDEDTFFGNPERSRIAHRIMSECKYGPNRKDVGINRLLLDGVYDAAYPLHDGNVEKKEKKSENLRQLLYRDWARWGRWYKLQPLDAIRAYLSDKIALYFALLEFYTVILIIPAAVGLLVMVYGIVTAFTSPTRFYLGDKIGIYFAWLGFYTQMLIIPTLVGIICLIYSVSTLFTYAPTREVCDPTFPTFSGNLTMCPLCDEICTYFKLGNSCFATQITYVFDNEATLFFAVFMSLWATMFLEFWKRRQFELAYQWDLVDYDEERDLVRPEYEAQIERERFNPATGKMETYMDPMDRLTRTGFSIVTVIFWVCLIIVAVFSIIVYRVAMHSIFAATINFSSLGVVGTIASPSLLTTITASLISLLIIMLLNKLYEKVALWLTNWEIPRTRVDFEDSFTMKIFFFQFVNFYSYLFYIAFFKSTFEGRPGDYNYLFGRFRWEGCDSGGCMYELSLQLVIIMFGKQLWNNVLELFLPWAMNKYRKYKSLKAAEEEDNKYTRWEKDYDLSAVNMDLFYEYLEMVIQFGFVTLFVVAFPLAPLLALLNNIVEIRLDAIKFICEFRRPLSLKTSDIGAWYYILELLGVLAVVTNSFTIAVTSETIPKLVYYYIYSFDEFGGNTYVGYVNNSLSVFDVSDFQPSSIPSDPNPFPGEVVTTCRYRDYRSPPSATPPYQHTLQYWHVFAARLAFVIVIEHVVFFLKALLDYLIPDRPKKLTAQIKREYYLVQNMLIEAEKEQLKEKLEQESRSSSSEPPDKKNSSNSAGAIAYENEMKTTPM